MRYKRRGHDVLYTQQKYAEMIADMPAADVLVTHCPPAGTLRQPLSYPRKRLEEITLRPGSRLLLATLLRSPIPRTPRAHGRLRLPSPAPMIR